jgi:hypothetical protein
MRRKVSEEPREIIDAGALLFGELHRGPSKRPGPPRCTPSQPSTSQSTIKVLAPNGKKLRHRFVLFCTVHQVMSFVYRFFIQ